MAYGRIIIGFEGNMSEEVDVEAESSPSHNVINLSSESSSPRRSYSLK